MLTTPPPEGGDTPELDALFRELGQPTAEFKAAKATIILWLFLYGLAFLLGTAAIVGGLVWAAASGFNLPFGGGAKGQLDWLKLGILVLSGVSISLLGAVFFRLKWRDLSNRVLVCPGGFINLGKKIDIFRWQDIEKVLQDYVAPRKDDSGPGPPMKSSTTFLVKRKDGGEFGFGAESLQKYARFARLLFAEAKARGIPWEFYVPQ